MIQATGTPPLLDQKDFDLILNSLPVLQEATPRLQRQLQATARAFQLDEGSSMFNDGDTCMTFVAVVSGVARVTKMAEDGRELLLYHVRPGDLCVLTMSCLLGGGAYPAQGRAGSSLRGIAFDGTLFEALVVNVPAFRRMVFGVLRDRFVDLMSLVEEVSFHRLDRRLARYLVEQSSYRHSDSLPLTHRSIAQDLGTSREIISRILESLAEQGILKLSRGNVKLESRADMERIAREGM